MSPPLEEVHLVPRREISLHEMSRFAASLGWHLDERPVEVAHGRDPDVPEAVWRIDRRAEVKLVRSQTLHHDFVVVKGRDTADVAGLITSRFPCFDLNEVLDQLSTASSTAERRDALYLLAAARPSECRRDAYEEIRRSLFDSDSLVRVAAITCAAWLGWRQLRPWVEKVSDEDSSENLRALSWNLLGLADWSRG